jgi:hypothetical protein
MNVRRIDLKLTINLFQLSLSSYLNTIQTNTKILKNDFNLVINCAQRLY